MKRLVPILLLAALGPGGLAAADVNRLKLRSQATVYGDAVRLADVLVFDRADPRLAQQVSGEVMIPASEARGTITVTHKQVVRRLDELGVNLARVLVSGSLACDVTLKQAAPREAEEDIALL